VVVFGTPGLTGISVLLVVYWSLTRTAHSNIPWSRLTGILDSQRNWWRERHELTFFPCL
jgi:hypothetical protein